jgi:hypothetical protein
MFNITNPKVLNNSQSLMSRISRITDKSDVKRDENKNLNSKFNLYGKYG